MDICEAHKKYDQEFLDEITEKVRDCSEKTEANVNYAKRIVISADGKILKLDNPEPDFLDAEVTELLEICRDKDDLWEYVMTQAKFFGKQSGVDAKTKEQLGWEPGKAVHSPDVTPEEFEDMIEQMKNFKCDCDGQH